MTQLVKRPFWTQVMISWFVGFSPASGSVLTGQSLEPSLDSAVSLSLSLPLPHSYSAPLSKINIKKKKFCFKKQERIF